MQSFCHHSLKLYSCSKSLPRSFVTGTLFWSTSIFIFSISHSSCLHFNLWDWRVNLMRLDDVTLRGALCDAGTFSLARFLLFATSCIWTLSWQALQLLSSSLTSTLQSFALLYSLHGKELDASVRSNGSVLIGRTWCTELPVKASFVSYTHFKLHYFFYQIWNCDISETTLIILVDDMIFWYKPAMYN